MAQPTTSKNAAGKARKRDLLRGYSLQPLFVLLLIATLVLIIKLGSGQTAILAKPTTRVLICFGLFMWSWVYYGASKTSLAIVFGILKIAAALWSDWYQLGKIGQEGWHTSAWDRWAFIVAALVVISSGFKDIAAGVKSLKS
jgi:hypothetical protein